MATTPNPRPQRKDAKKKLDVVAQNAGIKNGKTAANMMGLGKAYDNYYNPSRVAKPVAPSKPAPDRALNPKRSIGSGPSMKQPMSKTMPAPRNYGGMTAQPMPAFPGDSKGGIKTLPIRPTDPKPKIVPLSPKDPSIQNMPYIPPKDGSGPKAENMPYIPPKDGSGPKAENMPYITPGSPKLKPAKPAPQEKLKPAKPFTPPSKKMGKVKP